MSIPVCEYYPGERTDSNEHVRLELGDFSGAVADEVVYAIVGDVVMLWLGHAGRRGSQCVVDRRREGEEERTSSACGLRSAMADSDI